MIHHLKWRIDLPVAELVLYNCDNCDKEEIAIRKLDILNNTCEIFPPNGWFSTATYPLPPIRINALKTFCSTECLVAYYSKDHSNDE